MFAKDDMARPAQARRHGRFTRRVAFVLGLICLLLFMQYIQVGEPITRQLVSESEAPTPTAADLQKAFVVASTQAEDTSWIPRYLPEWQLYRYVIDDPEANYTVPSNKGREAMVYLTYIIDHYDSLPDISVFLHSGRYQWHNDDPLYDNVPLLRSLRLAHIQEVGYANLRCVWTLGCPSEQPTTVVPLPGPATIPTTYAYPSAFAELFPDVPLPSHIGNPCCAQFAVTRSAIHTRTLAEYEHYRTWLLNTELPDDLSGRVLEYSWHMVFGKPEVMCNDVQTCYCEMFGKCNVDCGLSTNGRCDTRWHYPPFANLPMGWPNIGWEGEWRSDEMLEEIALAGLPED